MNKQISELKKLLSAQKESDLTLLSSIRRRRAVCAKEITDLMKLKLGTGIHDPESAEISPVQIAGKDQDWCQFIDIKIAAKNSDLARISADCEEQKKLAQVSFGREIAFSKLLIRQKYRGLVK